ncbi:uncharacterized protein [Drosophila virilis]|uniref:Uncharacterized protein n=1 Tax=Drosophila virilis TaxID=7244 RepID=B4LSR1_DROVI|nr:uncharacterized protein LOC6628154 [Drosophila virilis]EDW63800.2 uncharacterized protein Dvir_GJ16707 [Drosophila virilis]
MRKRKVQATRADTDPLALPSRKPFAVQYSNVQSPKIEYNRLQTRESTGDSGNSRPKKLRQLLFDDFNEQNNENQEPVPIRDMLSESRAVKIKPVQRILNGELGRNVQSMQPLMSMDKELCPMLAEEEQEELAAVEPDLQTKVHQDSSPNQTIMQSQKNGHIVKQVTYYDTWYVIRPKIIPSETRQQRHYLELPLVKLANAAKHMKLPSDGWSSKVTLYKVAPAVLQRHTLTIFTGDLKVHKIPERERHKYQPSCVIFRRELPPQERNKCHVPYDRVVIFKHKQFTVNFDGKLVNLNGSPEAVTCLQDVQKLLDILESMTLSHSMIEVVTPK